MYASLCMCASVWMYVLECIWMYVFGKWMCMQIKLCVYMGVYTSVHARSACNKHTASLSLSLSLSLYLYLSVCLCLCACCSLSLLLSWSLVFFLLSVSPSHRHGIMFKVDDRVFHFLSRNDSPPPSVTR